MKIEVGRYYMSRDGRGPWWVRGMVGDSLFIGNLQWPDPAFFVSPSHVTWDRGGHATAAFMSGDTSPYDLVEEWDVSGSSQGVNHE